jgi:HrpA-like RNA helicase
LQAASRIKTEREVDSNSRGNSGALTTSRGRYKTKLGNEMVSIHPTSTLFGRHPSPNCVVFTEMVTTSRSYVRGVTQIREEWLHDVAPNFY